MTNLIPKYSLWEAINVAISLGMRALEEIRTLARLPGPPGEPGLGFDDMTVEQTGERSFVMRFLRGKQAKEFAFSMPVVIYRDVFKDGSAYEEGDAVTWGGSLWIAKGNTTAKPGLSEDWRLAVKRGRDGKDFKGVVNGAHNN